jgi:hypothetical protein
MYDVERQEANQQINISTNQQIVNGSYVKAPISK